MLRIVTPEEGADRPVSRFKSPRKGHGGLHVIVSGVDDGLVGKLHQFPDGMVEAFEIAREAVPDRPVEEGVAPEQEFIDMERTRLLRMAGGMDDPDLAPVQRNPTAVRQIRPAQEVGVRGRKQGIIAARVILVVMGVGDILQGKPMLSEKGKDPVRGAAVDGHTAFRSINQIPEIIGAVTKLFNLEHENTLRGVFTEMTGGAEPSPMVGLYRFENNIQVFFFAHYVDITVSVKESFVAGSPVGGCRMFFDFHQIWLEED